MTSLECVRRRTLWQGGRDYFVNAMYVHVDIVLIMYVHSKVAKVKCIVG